MRMSIRTESGAPCKRRARFASRLACTLAFSLPIGAAAGCEGGEGDPDTYTIPETPLAGTVGGQPWGLVMAETDPFDSSGEAFIANLYTEVVAPCSGAVAAPGSSYVSLDVPAAVGIYDLGPDHTATFVVMGVEYATYQGRIVVDEVGPTLIRGGANLDYDPRNRVSGRFEIAVCAL